MTKFQSILVTCFMLVFRVDCQAAETTLAVPMDYRLIRNILINQLYTGPDKTARLWKEGKDCSFLDLSNPQIAAEKHEVKIENTVHARIGLSVGGKCVALTNWVGILETFQKPVLDAAGNKLSFPISRAHVYDNNGQTLNIQQLEEIITKAVQPKLAELKIDLNQSRDEIIKTLLPFIDGDDTEKLQDIVNSLRFKRVEAGEQSLLIKIGFSCLKQKKADIKPAAIFSAEELQQWQAVWKNWSQSVENTLNQPALAQQTETDKATVREVLQAAGVAFEQALTTEETGAHDPVKAFFNDSWDKLGPLLRNVSQQLPGAEGLRYLTMIAATDLMYEVETITAPLGLEISSNGLRKLVRSYLADLARQPKP